MALALGANIFACSCAPPPEPKKALEQAKAVFLAEVVKIETEGQERTVKLKVERWWKGGDAGEITVSTAKSSAACGYGFEEKKKYLVYASEQAKDKPLHVSLCSRTRTDKEAEKSGDFKELGAGKAPSQ